MNHFLFTSGMISIHHTHKDYGIKQGLEACSSEQIMLMETLCRDVLRYIERYQVQACHFTLIATSTSSPVVKFNARSAQGSTQSELNARHLVFRFHLSYAQDHFKRPNQVLHGEILNISAFEHEFLDREKDLEKDLDTHVAQHHEVASLCAQIIPSYFTNYWLATHEKIEDYIPYQQIKMSKSLSGLGFVDLASINSMISSFPKQNTVSWHTRFRSNKKRNSLFTFSHIMFFSILLILLIMSVIGHESIDPSRSTYITSSSQVFTHSMPPSSSASSLKLDLSSSLNSNSSSNSSSKSSSSSNSNLGLGSSSGLHSASIPKKSMITTDILSDTARFSIRKCSIPSDLFKKWIDELKASHPAQSLLQRLAHMCKLIEHKEMTQSYLKDSMCPIDYTQPYFDPIAAHWHRSIWNEYVWLRQKANCMN